MAFASSWLAPPVQLIVPIAVSVDNVAGIVPLLATLNSYTALSPGLTRVTEILLNVVTPNVGPVAFASPN